MNGDGVGRVGEVCVQSGVKVSGHLRRVVDELLVAALRAQMSGAKV